MPKVVHFTRLYHPHIGGVEKHIAQLNKDLKEDGYDLSVITTNFLGDLDEFEENENEKIYRFKLPSEKNKFKYKLAVYRNIWKLRKVWLKADIIQIHDVFFWLLPFLPLVSNKVYITFHGYEGNELPTVKTKLWHELASLLVRGNICVGNFHSKWYSVFPNQLTYGAVQLIKVPKKKKNSELIYVGRLEKDNGLMVVLNALLKLKRAGRSYHLDVYGEGSLKIKAKDFVKKNGLSVKFWGNNPESAKILAQYRVAFVSRYLSILEALSSKTKVIAYSHNLLTDDYLQKTPFTNWIKIANHSDQIVSLLNQDFLLPNQAIKWAEKQSWQRLKNQYFKLWGVDES